MQVKFIGGKMLFLAIRNLMTGGGFEGGAYSGAWISAWITVGILGLIIFLMFILNKNDLTPIPFSIPGALIGILLAIVIISFTTWNKFALIVGLVGVIGGGIFLGRFQG